MLTRRRPRRHDAELLRSQNDARAAAASPKLDQLKSDNAAQLALSQTEADRLRAENDAQRASSQADLDRAARKGRRAENCELNYSANSTPFCRLATRCAAWS